MGLDNGLLAVKLYSHSVGSNHCPRTMTIETLLESGCGLCRNSAQDGCNDTCVKLEASLKSLGDPQAIHRKFSR